ncbi:hypothetical protein GH714_022019 [Hevea brasiliensis]|uniref:Enoyl reductase (ER) domain-containing protein n=1 Tax=Hevea brasiliensis TaxID=3981 RepID=A0A6A6K6P6_HEVBR|nr:hypothetical protein GH714_022019 [Hevea brasiliensis]
MQFFKLHTFKNAAVNCDCQLFQLSFFRFFATTCRAVLLPRFGGPEVLELRSDVEVPQLKPNQVLVRARAVSINPLDTRMRSGYGRSIFEPLLPLILGRDISGEVTAVGTSVQSLSVGQEVFGALHPTAVRGTYTDYAVLSEDELTPKPISVTHVEASAIPFAALTAWRALKSTARITEGQRLLVVGGGGAVGFTAIQLAVAAGCHVTTTCGSQSIEGVLKAGAEQAVDYIAEGEAASLTDRYGLAVGLPVATAILLKKQIQYRYSHGIEYWWTYMRADPDGLDEIRRLFEAGG